MDKMRKYFKIRKYVHRKIGIWKLKHAVKFFFDIDNETIEEFEDIIGKENVRVESVWIGKKCKKCTA